ncbi:hypothetical protein [Phaeobacter porticola]|uniref:hypothetical protein n=1 Tax=Phaeobacter porticola TaxID=1844006 RepID=UPI0012FF88B1|nr:hypothetical protein [Phaeobacter porticola]
MAVPPDLGGVTAAAQSVGHSGDRPERRDTGAQSDNQGLTLSPQDRIANQNEAN